MNFDLWTKTKRNHGLEHATLKVLLENGFSPPLAGFATPAGYFLYTKITREQVEVTAREALNRLNEGNKGIAVSEFCGTNIIISSLIAAIGTGMVMQRSKSLVERLMMVTGVVMLSMVLKTPLGNLVQIALTTGSAFEEVEIIYVKRLALSVYWIRTKAT